MKKFDPKRVVQELNKCFNENYTFGLTQKEKDSITNSKKDFSEWNTENYLKIFNQSNQRKKRALRSLVLQSTCNVCFNGKYKTFVNKEIFLQKAQLHQASKNSTMYYDDHKYKFDINPKSFMKFKNKCNIEVLNGDCIEACYILQRKCKNKVAVLNMANRYAPAICWPMHFATQEENLHRRSNLFQCLDDIEKIDKERTWKYPIDEFGSIYSPDVCFFKSSEDTGYKLIDKKFFGVLTAAALDNPNKKNMEEKMTIKIRNLFKVALENNVTNLVLSAWGSGAFRMDPTFVASIFKKVIEEEFQYCFENIFFAIYEDDFSFKKWNDKGNVMPYANVFKLKPTIINFDYKNL